MDWVTFVIPLIVVAVWLLSHLASLQQQLRKPPRVPPRRPMPIREVPISPPESKPGEEKQYRDELDRKRVKPTQRPAVRPRPRRMEPLPRPPLVLTPLPPPLTTYEDRLAQSAPVPTAPLIVQPMAKFGPPPIVAGRPNVALKSLLELLKKPENLAGAVLLKEILDLPVAKRARRRV